MPWEPPTENDFNQIWVTPSDALDILRADYAEQETRRRWILDRLKLGLIVAVARTGNTTGTLKQFAGIAAGLWASWSDWGDDHFWETGDARFTLGGVTGYGDGRTFRCQDVRFDPDSFSGRPPKSHPPEPGPVPPSEQSKGKGGAPRKGWWDDLWIEMIRRILANELKPHSAAELQRMMMDWLAEQEIYPGEDTLKKTAIKLFKYLQE